MPKVYGTNFALALPTELLGKVILVAKFPMEMKVDKEVERPAPPAILAAAPRPDGPLNFELGANCHNETAPTVTTKPRQLSQRNRANCHNAVDMLLFKLI